jgi:hypothetical protein
MRKKLGTIFFCILLTLAATDSWSQCAMCRRVAETSQSENSKSGAGLNKGIIYLLSVPYILGGIGLFAWYRNKKKV